MLNVDSMIEKNQEAVRSTKKERALSILRSVGFGALFAAGLTWHDQATDTIDSLHEAEISLPFINETRLNILIGTSVPLGMMELAGAGLSQYSLQQLKRQRNALDQLKEHEYLLLDIEDYHTFSASEIPDTPN